MVKVSIQLHYYPLCVFLDQKHRSKYEMVYLHANVTTLFKIFTVLPVTTDHR